MISFLLYGFASASPNLSNYQKYFNSLKSAEKQRISKEKVCLQETHNAYPEPIYYKGTQIPNVFIDKTVIADPELRYKVSCYLMNKLDLGINFEIDDYDSFVIKNKKIISECIYYLCHINYGRIHRQVNNGFDKLLHDELIQDELNLVIERLRDDKSLFFYSEPLKSQELFRDRKDLPNLQIGISYSEIISIFGKPDIINDTGNFLSIIYTLDNQISYKLKFSLAGNLNSFSIIKKDDREIILFCDLRLD